MVGFTAVARPKRQEERRGTLRRAASRAIRDGWGRVRLRDIADAAGMSPASVLYYYPDVDQLVKEAIQQAIERFYDRRAAVADSIEDPALQLTATIASGFPTGPDDQEVLLLYLGVPVIRRDPTVQALIRSLTARQVSLYQRILEVGQARGVFDLADDSLTISRNLVALEDAYGLYVINGDAHMVEEGKRLTLAYARLATRCPLVT
jgi:AcrR family transcriptional regulator